MTIYIHFFIFLKPVGQSVGRIFPTYKKRATFLCNHLISCGVPKQICPHIDGVKGHHPSAAQSRSGQFHDLHQRSAQPVPQMCEELADMIVTCPPPAQRAFFLGERTGRRCLTGITTASSGPDCVTGCKRAPSRAGRRPKTVCA